jgi:hypothetical protein
MQLENDMKSKVLPQVIKPEVEEIMGDLVCGN